MAGSSRGLLVATPRLAKRWGGVSTRASCPRDPFGDPSVPRFNFLRGLISPWPPLAAPATLWPTQSTNPRERRRDGSSLRHRSHPTVVIAVVVVRVVSQGV